VLAGQIGEVLVTARRKGDTWYLGGMSAKNARNLDLPLSFSKPVDLLRISGKMRPTPNLIPTIS